MMTVQRIEALLPQTQCGQCGYAGCAPYAQALLDKQAAINLCPPGGRRTINALAQLLQTAVLEPANPVQTDAPKVLALIDESECIGCTACIKACPVDAIVGATRLMHDVVALECTGCGLCVPPCPVDCIDLVAVDDDYLPRVTQNATLTAEAAAQHAKTRFERRNARLQRWQQHVHAERAAKQQAMRATSANQVAASTPAAFDAMALIAQASVAAKQQKKVMLSNQYEHSEAQIQAAVDAAAIRQALRDVEFGSEAEKQAAIQLMREQKQRRKNSG